jgi:type VI secretion system secreted protein VgrG
MAPTYTQDKRLLNLSTPLGKDVLLLAGFRGNETMSRLFSYQLEMSSTKDALSPKDIVGKNITWAVQHYGQQTRYFNGFVSRFSAAGRSAGDLRAYRAEVVPWLWFLTRTANCRIFQNLTAPQIIEKVFKDYGFSDYKLDVKRTCRKREYTVQYRETAFNFVSRLMEEEGIFYFFQHENGKHTLMMADHKGAYKDCPENKAWFQAGAAAPGSLTEWEHQYEFRPGKWAHTDYNFEDPSKSLLTNTKTTIDQPGMDKFEIFDYPGDYFVKGDGEAEVKLRMEEEEAAYDVVHSGSGCATFTPGGKFKVEGHAAPAEAGKGYVITSINHAATDASHTNNPLGTHYANTFTCIPDSVVFRPPRLTPRPSVMGPQPAVVVGPAGQELYTDKYGRIKVQFFWDREGKRDENSSCWMRVAQPVAGKRWGVSFWPRIGQEVIVGFHEGDPDRPFILGSLYNAEQMPPYQGEGLDGKHKSDNKVSGFKSNTTTGGVGFNELRFDDTKDKQEIFLHAERNLDTRVKNDSMERVIANRHLIVGYEKDGKKGGDQREMVYQDKHLHVQRHQVEHIEGNVERMVGKGQAQDGGNVDVVIEKTRKEQVGKDEHLQVKGLQVVKVDGTQDLTVGKDKTETVKGASHLHISGDHLEKVDGGISLTVGSDFQEKVGNKHAIDAGMEIHLKAGMKLILEAGVQLSLKGPGGFVDIGPSGVTIQGIMVLINSGGAAGSGSGSSPKDPKDAKEPEVPKEAKPTDPAMADDSKTGQKSAPG